jgi:hypothetical protein
MFDRPSFDQHERALFSHDAATGLQAGVAVTSFAGRPDRCGFWDGIGARAHSAGVPYASGYAINARGIPRRGRGYTGVATAEALLAETHRIPARFDEFFACSSATNRPACALGDEMARQLLAEAR